DRLLPLASGLPSDQRDLFLDNLHIHSCDRSIRLDKDIAPLEKVVASIRPEIVCFDPLIEFHQAEENSASEMQKVMRGIDYIRDKFHAAASTTQPCRKGGVR